MSRKRRLAGDDAGRSSSNKAPAKVNRTSEIGEGTGTAVASKWLQRAALIAGAPLAAGLYLVSTPIGNAGDISLRALAVLAGVDVIACEDTRITARLLAIYGISRPLVACHDHNADRVGPALIARVRAGERVALATDAGTPLVSDPGYRLVRAAIAEGVAVTAIPGASAVTAALVVAGLPTDRFLFAGFPPARAAARRRWLADLVAIPATLVVMEAPHRLAACLADMAAVLGPRSAAVARELTKLFEEVRRDDLTRLAAAYAVEPQPKGELTIVVAPPAAAAPTLDDVDARLREAIATHGIGRAASLVAAATGLPRSRLYARALALRAAPP